MIITLKLVGQALNLFPSLQVGAAKHGQAPGNITLVAFSVLQLLASQEKALDVLKVVILQCLRFDHVQPIVNELAQLFACLLLEELHSHSCLGRR